MPPSSSPCNLHELAEGVAGYEFVDPQQALDVTRWRKATRDTFLARRASASVEGRKTLSCKLSAHLEAFLETRFSKFPDHCLSGYWPIKSEPDLRDCFVRLHERHMRLALPVVEKKSAPLAFYAWRPGDRMERGFWNIPVPTEKIKVTPDILLAPLLGWDRDGYRLGYGGGYFDRTLAAMTAPRYVIGIGLQAFELKTIFPQPHDVRLDAILTERGIEWSRD